MLSKEIGKTVSGFVSSLITIMWEAGHKIHILFKPTKSQVKFPSPTMSKTALVSQKDTKVHLNQSTNVSTLNNIENHKSTQIKIANNSPNNKIIE
jgi:hypothetical protein